MQQDAASKMAHNIAHTAVMQMTLNLLIGMFPPEQKTQSEESSLAELRKLSMSVCRSIYLQMRSSRRVNKRSF